MKTKEFIPFVLLIIGTFGLLIIEFTGGSRYLTLIFAIFNLLGLIVLALACKKS